MNNKPAKARVELKKKLEDADLQVTLAEWKERFPLLIAKYYLTNIEKSALKGENLDGIKLDEDTINPCKQFLWEKFGLPPRIVVLLMMDDAVRNLPGFDRESDIELAKKIDNEEGLITLINLNTQAFVLSADIDDEAPQKKKKTPKWKRLRKLRK